MKILIISHNPLTDQSNMGKTLCSLFSEFAPEELCQLYIYPTIPNEKRCGSFFRMTDKDALRAVLDRRFCGGERKAVCRDAGMYEHSADARFYRQRILSSAPAGLLRDAMWRHSGWYNGALRVWLEKEKPDGIFVAPGGAAFLYDFALCIGTDLGIPIVTYLCDEHYFVRNPRGLLARRQLRLRKAKMEALMARTAHLVAICPELLAPYRQRFGVPATVLMTGASVSLAGTAQTEAAPEAISYFGNIRCNRYLALADVASALDAINGALGTHYRLRVYTAERDRKICRTLQKHDSVEWMGFLTGAAFTAALRTAGLLLHVEAFDEKSAETVKHSVSTKIADSLASGVPLVAYGPENVASTAYLRRNGCAIVASSPVELKETLLAAFTQETLRRDAVERALQVAAENHDAAQNSTRLREIWENVLRREKE